jgi:hypothetical protein
MNLRQTIACLFNRHHWARILEADRTILWRTCIRCGKVKVIDDHS